MAVRSKCRSHQKDLFLKTCPACFGKGSVQKQRLTSMQTGDRAGRSWMELLFLAMSLSEDVVTEERWAWVRYVGLEPAIDQAMDSNWIQVVIAGIKKKYSTSGFGDRSQHYQDSRCDFCKGTGQVKQSDWRRYYERDFKSGGDAYRDMVP